MESELDKIIVRARSAINVSALTYDYDWISHKVREGEILMPPKQTSSEQSQVLCWECFGTTVSKNNWDLDRQSVFIERLILNLPVDPIHFEVITEPEYKYLAVKNYLQLQAYIDFVCDKKFELTKTNIVPELVGKGYDDLSHVVKRRLRNKPQDLYVYHTTLTNTA